MYVYNIIWVLEGFLQTLIKTLNVEVEDYICFVIICFMQGITHLAYNVTATLYFGYIVYGVSTTL